MEHDNRYYVNIIKIIINYILILFNRISKIIRKMGGENEYQNFNKLHT